MTSYVLSLLSLSLSLSLVSLRIISCYELLPARVYRRFLPVPYRRIAHARNFLLTPIILLRNPRESRDCSIPYISAGGVVRKVSSRVSETYNA